jgi:hypothetical protein
MRDDVRVALSDERMRALAARLTEVPGMLADLLGGSRARGADTPDSDTDLGLYYRAPLDAALGRLAVEVACPAAQVSDRGEWGPAAALPGAPLSFRAQVDALVGGLSADPARLAVALDAAADLVLDVADACVTMARPGPPGQGRTGRKDR